jgi:hypothetical protein
VLDRGVPLLSQGRCRKRLGDAHALAKSCGRAGGGTRRFDRRESYPPAESRASNCRISCRPNCLANSRAR